MCQRYYHHVNSTPTNIAGSAHRPSFLPDNDDYDAQRVSISPPICCLFRATNQPSNLQHIVPTTHWETISPRDYFGKCDIRFRGSKSFLPWRNGKSESARAKPRAGVRVGVWPREPRTQPEEERHFPTQSHSQVPRERELEPIKCPAI